MSTLGKVNQIRRLFMRRLTRNIGGSPTARNSNPEEKASIKRILVSRPNNRLGNLLLITPLLQEIEETFPGCKTDLFVRGGLAPQLFKNYPSIDRIIRLPGKPFKQLMKYTNAWLRIKSRRYDLVINVIGGSSSGRLSTKFSRGNFKLFGDVSHDTIAKHKDCQHVAKYPVYNLREFMGINDNKPVPRLNIRLTPDEIAAGKKILYATVPTDKKTIAIFTYATGAKCYACSWWEPFYERLKTEFPDYNILEILPLENVSQIGFKAPSFYGKDIREVGAVIANCELFIGADSGIMHLASAVQTPTVGLFYVSNPDSFEPYGDNSVALNTNEGGMEEWINIIKRIAEK